MFDTIAATATALSDSGIGIIRVSGDESIMKVNDIFQTKSGKKKLTDFRSHTINYGFIVDANGDRIDEVMVSIMKAPKSYTAEDVVEINCHGGVYVTKKILDRVLSTGIRLALPGEFTKRAFLNGRIDLSKAEAVMDLINSKNQYALKASVNQLSGNLYNKIDKFRKIIIHELAFIESAIDDPEHFDLSDYPDTLKIKITDIICEISKLIESSDNGKIIKEGISTVIVGKPNVGKSSFLNSVLGEERAIVTDVAGTTRDILKESVNINGITLNIVDTAGIRDTDDYVEQIGVNKAREYAQNADLIIFVIDSSAELDDEDLEIFKLLENKKVIVLLNKSDLPGLITIKDIEEKLSHTKEYEIIKTSIKDNTGLDDFNSCVSRFFFDGIIESDNEVVITRQRHKEALENAKKSLLLVSDSIDTDMPEDFYSIDLMSAYTSLGLIIGEEVEDDLVEEIFSKFCMGK